DFRKIKSGSTDMWMSQANLRRRVSLRSAHVDESGIVFPWKLGCDRQSAAAAYTAHRRQEFAEPSRVRVKGFKQRCAATADFILRFTGAQRLSKMAPEPVQAMIRHLQNPTDIRGLPLVQEHPGGRRISVLVVLPYKEA